MAMPFASIRSARRSSSLLLMCVLALALAVSLQGMAAGMLAAKGPAHMHRQAEALLWAQGFTLLSDFRRDDGEGKRPKQSTAIAESAYRDDAISVAPQRHHHPRNDASVLRSEPQRLIDAAGGDEGASPAASGAFFLAVLPTALTWPPSAAAQSLPSRPTWPSSTRYPGRLERPPRHA